MLQDFLSLLFCSKFQIPLQLDWCGHRGTRMLLGPDLFWRPFFQSLRQKMIEDQPLAVQRGRHDL